MARSVVELVDAWRSDPSADSTIKLCEQLVRQTNRPGRTTPEDDGQILAFCDQATDQFIGDVEVSLSVAGLFLTIGELERAERSLAGLPAAADRDPRVKKLRGKVQLHRGIQDAHAGGPISTVPIRGRSAPPPHSLDSPSGITGPSTAQQLLRQVRAEHGPSASESGLGPSGFVSDDPDDVVTRDALTMGRSAPYVEDQTTGDGLPTKTFQRGDDDVDSLIAAAESMLASAEPPESSRRNPGLPPLPPAGVQPPPSSSSGFSIENADAGARAGAFQVPEVATGDGARSDTVAAVEASPRNPSRPRPILIGLSFIAAAFLGFTMRPILSSNAEATDAAVNPGVTEDARVASVVGDVRSAILSGGPEGLETAGRALSAEGALVERHPELSLLRVQREVVRMLDADGDPSLVKEGLEAARAAGVSEPRLTFAELALALRESEAGGHKSNAILAKADADTELRSDAFYQWVAGLVLEQTGDEKALQRFQAATGAEPGFRSAEVGLIAAELVYGAASLAQTRLEAFAELEPTSPRTQALLQLEWLTKPADQRGEFKGPPPQSDVRGMPLSLQWVADAMKYVQSNSEPERDKIILKAASETQSGHVHLLLAQLALEASDYPSVLAIAKSHDKQRSPELTALLGEAALALGDLDALNVNGDDTQSTTLRVVRAYEQGDTTAVSDLLSRGSETSRLLWFQKRLRGNGPELSSEEKSALEKGELLGGRLLLIDLALDQGELDDARTLLEREEDKSQALKARRWARLLRYEGKTMEAYQALKDALPTVPAQIEGALISGERASLAKSAVLTFDPSAMKEGLFLKAYLLAQAGSRSAALSLLTQTKPPEEGEPMSSRLAAALAYGSLKYPNGLKLIRSLVDSNPRHPDVRRAAKDAQIPLPPLVSQ